MSRRSGTQSLRCALQTGLLATNMTLNVKLLQLYICKWTRSRETHSDQEIVIMSTVQGVDGSRCGSVLRVCSFLHILKVRVSRLL